MATTSGVTGGSQLDVASLAQQLVAAERKPLDDQISRESSRITTQISSLGSLMGSMSSFRVALSSMKTTDAFASRQATSSDPEKFTASVTAKAAPGTYDVEVVQLATAQQISSTLFATGADQVVGTGTLTVSLGTASVSINVESGKATLANIRDAINSASGNPGVRATLVKEGDGAHLVLTSQSTGAAQKISLSQTGGDGGLAQITYGPSNLSHYAQLKPAQDAIVKVASYQSTSATNTVSNAIDGVTLNLLEADLGETKTLTVSYDRAAVTSKINNFVSAYNALKTQITKLSGYNAATKTGGAMLGDSMLSSIDSQMRRLLQDPVEGVSKQLSTLANVGITTQADGTLTVDSGKLQTALNSNLDEVGKLFGGTNGVAARLFSKIEESLKSNGAIDVRSQNLVKQQKALSNKAASIDSRMVTLRANYVRQFTTLDNMLSKMQTTSSFLSQQIDQLASLAKSNN